MPSVDSHNENTYYLYRKTKCHEAEYMRNLHEPTYSFVILTFILIIVDTLLAWFSVRLVPAGANGLAWIFIAVAFMLLFTLWFGTYGAIAA